MYIHTKISIGKYTKNTSLTKTLKINLKLDTSKSYFYYLKYDKIK